MLWIYLDTAELQVQVRTKMTGWSLPTKDHPGYEFYADYRLSGKFTDNGLHIIDD